MVCNALTTNFSTSVVDRTYSLLVRDLLALPVFCTSQFPLHQGGLNRFLAIVSIVREWRIPVHPLECESFYRLHRAY